ncbi:MAG TPA: DUF1236 domain-containing protein [Arsenicitalea sp.]|jgi:hypothetical protein|nr:DUF1236 domain-containing protein [Arsenicitalea sp.]
MRKVLLAGVALLTLGAASPALAQYSDRAVAGAAVGGAAGATTGAAAGFFLGGPLGAVIGGFTGAALGSSAGISSSSMDYVSRHPVQPLVGDVRIGARLGPDVTIYPIQGDRRHGYIYANDRAYVVNLSNRRVLASPGYAIPQRSVNYAMSHRSGAAKLKGDVGVGYRVPGNISLTAIPDDATYSYVYINGRPALVDNRSHTLVWMSSGG